MATDDILALLLIERDKLTAAIEALQGATPKVNPSGPDRKAVTPSVAQNSKPQAAVVPTGPAKRKLSASGRQAIIAATKRRWAAVRAAKAAKAPLPSKAVPAKASVRAKKGSHPKGKAA